ncbi:MAG TPA: DMT family transporter [Candidatus Limnocylindrales bacterium]|nr:DMT family transporter [Candidatus Limnocylindrales bacterium]
MRGRRIGIVLTVISACGFGSGPLFAKPIYAAGVDWLTLSVWRFIFAAVVSWLWLLAVPESRRALKRISRRRLVVLFLLGVFYVGNTATYYAGLETVPASLAALIIYVYPAIVAVLALRFGRRLRGRRPWYALTLAMVGVALAVGNIAPDHVPPATGLLLMVASPLIYAAWIILSARLAGERSEPRDTPPPEAVETVAMEAAAETTDPAPAAAIMLTATCLVYLLVAPLAGHSLSPADVPLAAWPGLLGVGLVSGALAMQAFYAGAKRIGAAQAALVSTVEPVWTISLAVLLFGEQLTPLQLVGGVCIIVAVLLAETTPDASAVDLRQERALNEPDTRPLSTR